MSPAQKPPHTDAQEIGNLARGQQLRFLQLQAMPYRHSEAISARVRFLGHLSTQKQRYVASFCLLWSSTAIPKRNPANWPAPVAISLSVRSVLVNLIASRGRELFATAWTFHGSLLPARPLRLFGWRWGLGFSAHRLSKEKPPAPIPLLLHSKRDLIVPTQFMK